MMHNPNSSAFKFGVMSKLHPSRNGDRFLRFLGKPEVEALDMEKHLDWFDAAHAQLRV
jgi:hypothetical protein